MKKPLPKNCADCPVFKHSLFKEFNHSMIVWLANKKQTVNLHKKENLFKQGDSVDGIYCHMDGLAKVDQLDNEGNVRYSRLVLPGDTSGHRSIFINNTYKGTATVLSDELTACFIKKADMVFLFSVEVLLAKNLIVKLSHELTRSEDAAISVREKSVRERLSSLLIRLGENFSESQENSTRILKCAISKKDLSDLLLVAPETIIRLMSEMKNEGLIDYDEKRLVINDVYHLKELAKDSV